MKVPLLGILVPGDVLIRYNTYIRPAVRKTIALTIPTIYFSLLGTTSLASLVRPWASGKDRLAPLEPV